MVAAVPPASPREVVADAFERHKRFLWGLCYRMLGSAADADDLVQETFARALARPPRHTDEPLRPWLVQVATNLARDLLRRRRRGGYVGPWLPSPIPTDDDEPPAHEPVLLDDNGRPITTEARYDLMESVSFAFLLALEALTPRQRAVLLLRDVFDYSVARTADALAMTDAHVKVTHHRARRAMHGYDRVRVRLSRERRQAAGDVLVRFLSALTRGDAEAAEALLAEDVKVLSDGGGEFLAARKPVVGRARVVQFYRNLLTRHAPPDLRAEARVLNGAAAVVVEGTPPRPNIAARTAVVCELNADGQISRLYSVLATRKLSALDWSASPPHSG